MRSHLFRRYIIFVSMGLLSNTELSHADTSSAVRNHQKLESDNTAINQRDRSPKQATAQSQSNATSDIEITQQIRKELMDADGLSTNAKNIKVITANDTVTIKGPVSSLREKKQVINIAKRVAPQCKVHDQVNVTNKTSL